jgi:hypothetical protein
MEYKMRSIKDYFRSDGEPERFEILSYWAPTKDSGDKVILIQIECAINTPWAELDNRTPFEDIVLHKNTSNFFRKIPDLEKSPLFEHYQKVLPLNNREFIYRSVYSKTGGVLNIFHPEIKESMDNELKELFAKYEDKKQAIRIWRDAHSELWSNLTPKLVWAGGGEIEGKLLRDFLEQLTDGMEDEEFDSEGDCIISSMRLLREWQLRPNKVCFGDTPMDAIKEERLQTYEHKISFLQEMQIETDFA